MRMTHLFLIDSDSSGHRLSVDGQEIGTFASLGGAAAHATEIARGYEPAVTLTFGLDFKSTLSDLETRAATLESPARDAAR